MRQKGLIDEPIITLDQSFLSQNNSITDSLLHVSTASMDSVVVEAAGQIVADYIVEAGHIVDTAERKEIAEDTQQEKMVGIAVEKRDFVDLVLPAGEDS